MPANDPRSPQRLVLLRAQSVLLANDHNFVIIAVLSVPPTLRYLRWQRTEILPNNSQIRSVCRIIWIEVVLVALLPVFAAAMARGFGEYPFL